MLLMDSTLQVVLTALICSVVVGGATFIVMGRAASQALSEALSDLELKAEKQREEALRLATNSVKEQGDSLLGQKAQQIDAELQKYQQALVKALQDNAQSYGELNGAVVQLAKGTEELRRVLYNPSKRGQWGERLAKDIFDLAGLIEGKNYFKQASLAEGERGRPDYRIVMPPQRTLFMDAKFPLEQYSSYVAAEDEDLKRMHKEKFLDDLRGHIKALAKKDYVTKADGETLDYVLMFVPNESISAFVNEADPKLLDTALKERVVVCTPLTLYAFLVVIRQATDSFHTQESAAEIMKHINLFSKQWEKYTSEVGKVEKQFQGMVDTLHSINVGGTRHNKLKKQVTEIERLRKQAGVPELTAEEARALEAGDEEVIEGEFFEDDKLAADR